MRSSKFLVFALSVWACGGESTEKGPPNATQKGALSEVREAKNNEWCQAIISGADVAAALGFGALTYKPPKAAPPMAKMGECTWEAPGIIAPKLTVDCRAMPKSYDGNRDLATKMGSKVTDIAVGDKGFLAEGKGFNAVGLQKGPCFIMVTGFGTTPEQAQTFAKKVSDNLRSEANHPPE